MLKERERVMAKHIIPVNISADGNLFGGAIKKRNAIEAAGILLIGVAILKFILFALPFIIKACVYFLISIVPAVLALIGIGDQSMLEWISNTRSYRKGKDVIPFLIPTQEEEEEEYTDDILEQYAIKFEKKKKKRRERAEKKRQEKQRAREEKLARKREKELARASRKLEKKRRRR